MLFGLRDVTVSVGGEEILSHVDFEIRGTEKIALVGANGAGKSTLLKVLSGELTIDRDDKRNAPGVLMDRKISVETLSQQVFMDLSVTVDDELLKGFYGKGATYSVDDDGFEKNIETENLKSTDKYDRERFLYEFEYDKLLTGFGFDKADKKKKLGEFSGGQMTKLALIRVLLARPDLLLLDEPTNHLDMAAVEWLEEYLKKYDRAVVVVSHDRFFIDRVADIIVEVADGSLTRYVGNYSEYVSQKQKTYDIQKKAYDRYMEEKVRLDDLIKRFKGKPNKASMARAKQKQLERIPVPPKPKADFRRWTLGDITPDIIGAKWVYEAEHMKVGYKKVLYELSLRIRRGAKIAVIGVNGSGKTALLKTVAGEMPAISGKNALGNQILLGYYDQKSGEISSEKSVIEHFHELYPGINEKELYQLLAVWMFDGKMAGRQVSVLSGGEKSRLIMAELLYGKPNFCVLDEPTNHMDIQAKELLEDAFSKYKGTMLFVSHDRYFINRVADALLIIENGEVYYYPFGYEHYLEHKNKPEEVPLAGQMKAEDAALLASMKAVPKREYIQLHDEPDEIVYRDWKRRLMDEELDRAYEIYDEEMLNATDISSWDMAEEKLNKAINIWIDKYMEEI